MYRLKEAGLGFSLVDNFKWLLFFFFFFSGMSWHLTTALVAHLITYNSQLPAHLLSLLPPELTHSCLSPLLSDLGIDRQGGVQ